MTHHESHDDQHETGQDEGRNEGPEPIESAEQEAPEPVRPERVDEKAGEGLQERENPPQAEGPPDRA